MATILESVNDNTPEQIYTVKEKTLINRLRNLLKDCDFDKIHLLKKNLIKVNFYSYYIYNI